MLKSVKNLLLHDIPPDDTTFISNPGSYLKQLLFETRNSHYGSKESLSTSKSLSSSSAASMSSSASSSGYTLEMVDDGHALGLGNPEILKLIFRHLSTKDLLKARQVNLRWNVTACFFIRSRLPHLKLPPSRLPSFRKLMHKNIANPFSSYAIRIDYVWDKETYKFLARFSPEISRLRVRLNITEFTEFAKFLQKMINLKELHIIAFNDRQNNSSSYLSALLEKNGSSWDIANLIESDAWRLGLYKFPKLSKLTFENLDASYKIHSFFDKLVANIIRACGRLTQINFINWTSPLGKSFTKFGIKKPGIIDTVGKGSTSEEIVNLFFNTNLIFFKIRLETNPDISFELLSDVIHKCSESLLELGLANENIFEKFAISSALHRLERLKLSCWQGPVDFLYFTRQFPALRHLSLNLSNLFEVESGLVHLGEIEPCKTLRTLTLMRLETGVNVELIEKLSVMFPYVSELFVEVKNGLVLQKIYQVYPDLTLLCLELKNDVIEEEQDGYHPIPLMTNEAFTGVPDDKITIIEERECGCPIIDFAEEIRGHWNIGCLKNLATLLIRVPNTVNNIALQEGIARLNKLENLVLLPFYSHDELPTKWCMRSIADNFPRLKTLVTSTEVQYLVNEMDYLFNKLPGLVHKTKP